MMNSHPDPRIPSSGIFLVDKPRGKTSFSLVAALRRHTRVAKIGHAGTLDPFATGLMVMLIGREFTRQSDTFLGQDKEYQCELLLGKTTDSYDIDGAPLSTSDLVPSLEEIAHHLVAFQGTILQTPPMYSAKKVGGKKLYELARKGIEIPRTAVPVTLTTTLIQYAYPILELHVSCSKGTYIRSLAHDLGQKLGCGAHLTSLRRLRSGPFLIENAMDGALFL